MSLTAKLIENGPSSIIRSCAGNVAFPSTCHPNQMTGIFRVKQIPPPCDPLLLSSYGTSAE